MGKSEFPNGVGTASQSPMSGSTTTKSASPSIKNHLFAEKLVPVLIDLFLSAPRVEEYNIFPEIIQGLGRCMATRRDNPDGALWRLSVEGFNRILVDDVSRISVDGLQDPIITRPSRTRLWKEVADVYEIFLVGSCGRALPSKVMSSATLKADESLEMTILDVLGDNILSKQSDAPDDILLRLISTLDRCASRTCCLPVETVELMPSHCSKFSLTCLQKLFLLCRYSNQTNVWSAARSRVSRISVSVVMNRCEFILNKFLIDEKNLGERLLPALRIEEIVYVLEELSHLIIHIETALVLPLKPYLIEALPRIESYGSRAHLLVLFPSFCELVISRVATVRELVQVLLKLISSELGIQKINLA